MTMTYKEAETALDNARHAWIDAKTDEQDALEARDVPALQAAWAAIDAARADYEAAEKARDAAEDKPQPQLQLRPGRRRRVGPALD